jgi:hypothetical protein
VNQICQKGMNMKKTLLVLISATLLLSACQSAQPSPQAQDSQQAQASAAPSGQPPVVQASGDLCANPYIPAVEGATWSYTFHTDQGDNTQVDTVTDVGSDAFLVETTRSDGFNYVITWTCTPEGLLWLQTDGGMFSGIFQGGGLSQSWETVSYSGVSIPKDGQAGDSWSSDQQISVTDSTGTRNFGIAMNFQAVGKESVTVSAGTFAAMRVDFTMAWSGDGIEMTYLVTDWFVENVGLVKTTAQADFGSYSLELVSYSIP